MISCAFESFPWIPLGLFAQVGICLCFGILVYYILRCCATCTLLGGGEIILFAGDGPQ